MIQRLLQCRSVHCTGEFSLFFFLLFHTTAKLLVMSFISHSKSVNNKLGVGEGKELVTFQHNPR